MRGNTAKARKATKALGLCFGGGFGEGERRRRSVELRGAEGTGGDAVLIAGRTAKPHLEGADLVKGLLGLLAAATLLADRVATAVAVRTVVSATLRVRGRREGRGTWKSQSRCFSVLCSFSSNNVASFCNGRPCNPVFCRQECHNLPLVSHA